MVTVNVGVAGMGASSGEMMVVSDMVTVNVGVTEMGASSGEMMVVFDMVTVNVGVPGMGASSGEMMGFVRGSYSIRDRTICTKTT